MTTISEFDELDCTGDYFQHISLNSKAAAVDPLFPVQRNFAERVQLITDKNKVSCFLVDSRILVKGPSDVVRVAEAKKWESQRDEATWWGRFHVVSVISSMIVAAVAGAYLLYPVAIAGAVNAVAGIVFAIKNYNRAEAAQSKVDQWNQHPAERVATERAKAYNQGFFYCLNNGLKGCYGTIAPQNILHPEEVTWLYEQSLTKMMKDVGAQSQRQNISSSEKTRWVERFISQNPLSYKAIDYAYQDHDPKRRILAAWSPSFEAYSQDVSSVRKYFAEKSNQICTQARNEINRLNDQRNLALSVPLAFKISKNNEARQARDEALRVEGLSEYDRNRAIRDCEDTLKSHETYYLLVATPINMYYDKCVNDVKVWKSGCLEKIERDRSSGIAPYFQPALNLLAGAYNDWEQQKTNEAAFYRSQQYFFADLAPIPTAPPYGA